MLWDLGKDFEDGDASSWKDTMDYVGWNGVSRFWKPGFRVVTAAQDPGTRNVAAWGHDKGIFMAVSGRRFDYCKTSTFDSKSV